MPLVSARPQARLGIGTASLLSGYGLEAAPVDGHALLRHALAGGIDYIDTAAAYGDSEATLGELADAVRAGGVTIATKLSASELEAGALARTLARLRQPSVDTLLVHSTAAGGESTRPAVADRMAAAVHASQVARPGVSTYGVANARLALEQPWCRAIQIEFSVLNPSVLRAVAAVRRPDQQVIARSVLCKGLLTSRRASAPVPQAAHDLIDALEARAVAWGMTLPELALRYALDAPGIDVVIVGAGTAREIDEAVAVRARAPLTSAQLNALAAFDRSADAWTHPETWAA